MNKETRERSGFSAVSTMRRRETEGNEETRLQLHLINLARYVGIIAETMRVPTQGSRWRSWTRVAAEIYLKNHVIDLDFANQNFHGSRE